MPRMRRFAFAIISFSCAFTLLGCATKASVVSPEVRVSLRHQAEYTGKGIYESRDTLFFRGNVSQTVLARKIIADGPSQLIVVPSPPFAEPGTLAFFAAGYVDRGDHVAIVRDGATVRVRAMRYSSDRLCEPWETLAAFEVPEDIPLILDPLGPVAENRHGECDCSGKKGRRWICRSSR